MILLVAIGLSILGSFGGLLTASTFLLLGDGLRLRLVPWLVSYAVGTLVGVALLALVPEALAHLAAARRDADTSRPASSASSSSRRR